MLQNNHHNLAEYLSDFYRYLTMQDGVNAHSRTNYISWLKFLDSQGYALEQLNSQDDIMDILANEKLLQKDREKYTKDKDLSNFKAALNRFLQFRKSDYAHQQEETVLAEINQVRNNYTLTETEREAIVKSRIGQGYFRDQLVNYWHGCSISAFQHYDLLIASHIKP